MESGSGAGENGNEAVAMDNKAVEVKKEPELGLGYNHGDTHSDTVAEDGEVELSHKEAMSVFETNLAHIIQNDPLLCGLHSEVTLEEINSQIALEYGQAIAVNVKRDDGEILKIVVVQNATVLDLKKAIRRHVTLKQKRANGTSHISWKYIWKRYWLYFDGQKLMEDKKPIKEYGIRNKSEVTFMKRLRER